MYNSSNLADNNNKMQGYSKLLKLGSSRIMCKVCNSNRNNLAWLNRNRDVVVTNSSLVDSSNNRVVTSSSMADNNSYQEVMCSS